MSHDPSSATVSSPPSSAVASSLKGHLCISSSSLFLSPMGVVSERWLESMGRG
ncbi:unnamed protein product [Cuscuta epithymum]|uniref:Uncharacterized protein n=1 Tax=Cuscuta epithymum TaxID=186058 RepID=A0AAV0DJX9_9ASTE|nr:unnamed protein product [Cuscuta epithymum]